jgi:hypothetical protein
MSSVVGVTNIWQLSRVWAVEVGVAMFDKVSHKRLQHVWFAFYMGKSMNPFWFLSRIRDTFYTCIRI